MQNGSGVPLSRSALLAAGLMVGLLSMAALASQRDAVMPTVSAPAATTDRAAATETQARALREGRPLDLNRATADELRLLPGIGPKLAARIVEARVRLGRYSTLAELDAVPGIGAKKLSQIAPLITIGPASQSGNNQPTESVNAK